MASPNPEASRAQRRSLDCKFYHDHVVQQPRLFNQCANLIAPCREDGTIDHSSAAARPSAHKLGPKANQGAINAGLRALDRSGKPCRKWAKGGFKLKSFTGVAWEIPRWTAPQRINLESGTEDSTAPSAEGSNKENKENGNEGNSVSNSNSGPDIEMQSAPSIQASSPAPIAVAAAS